MQDTIKRNWKELLFGKKAQIAVVSEDSAIPDVSVETTEITQKSEVLRILRANTHRYMAVHEIGNEIRASGAFHSDCAISALLRKPTSKWGLKERVEGRRRGTSTVKEWKLI